MRILILLFFLSNFIFSQNIEVKINIITNNDISPKKRTNTINYQIENKTNNEISFFLTPNTLIANAASSMNLFTVYENISTTNWNNDHYFKQVDLEYYLYKIKNIILILTRWV